MRIRLTSHAVADLQRALDHYRAVDPALGDRFLDDVDAAIERLEMFPAGAPPIDGFADLRRARMRRFPYGIFYRHSPSEKELLVVRVLHTRRDQAGALTD